MRPDFAFHSRSLRGAAGHRLAGSERMGRICGCASAGGRFQRGGRAATPLVARESMQERSGRRTVVFSTPQTARYLRGHFLSRGGGRLSRSESLESRSSTHVFAVSHVFREDDLRSRTGGNLLAAGAPERGGVRLTRPHRGIRMVGLR